MCVYWVEYVLGKCQAGKCCAYSRAPERIGRIVTTVGLQKTKTKMSSICCRQVWMPLGHSAPSWGFDDLLFQMGFLCHLWEMNCAMALSSSWWMYMTVHTTFLFPEKSAHDWKAFGHKIAMQAKRLRTKHKTKLGVYLWNEVKLLTFQFKKQKRTESLGF